MDKKLEILYFILNLIPIPFYRTPLMPAKYNLYKKNYTLYYHLTVSESISHHLNHHETKVRERKVTNTLHAYIFVNQNFRSAKPHNLLFLSKLKLAQNKSNT